MSLFVDASALVSILAEEDDKFHYVDRIGEAPALLWSPIVKWEAVAVLTRILKFTRAQARSYLMEFGRDWDFTLVPIGEREDAIAFEAYRTYGKGSGHPARLNMGDCFAYACAKAAGARLLYKGEDFAMTDLAR